MALYQRLFLVVNGQLLAENTSVDLTLEGDIPNVETTARNWAGITPAPLRTAITAQNVLPLPGAEFDFEKRMKNFAAVEIMLQQSDSGKKYTTTGYITNVPTSAAVGQNTTVSFTFVGEPASWV